MGVVDNNINTTDDREFERVWEAADWMFKNDRQDAKYFFLKGQQVTLVKHQLQQLDEVPRIRQLEKQCAVLAAEVDRMRPVIEAAHHWASGNPPVDRYQRLLWALRTYEASNPK